MAMPYCPPTRPARLHWLWPLVTGLLVLNPTAFAAGLGKGQLKSQLGQALDAEFEIIGDAGEPLSERCFKIIKPLDRDFDAEDISRGTLTLDRNARDQRILRLSSNQPVTEPIVNVTLQMSCGSSPFIRKYTFLPEVPSRRELAGEAAPVSAPASAPSSTTVAAPAAAAPAPTQVQAAQTGQASTRPATAVAASSGQSATTVAKPRVPRVNKENTRRRGQDRLSIGTIAALQPEYSDAPLVLKMSQTLGLMGAAPRERTAPQEALLALERRLAERANDMSLGQYETKERLRELIDALEEARALARQLPEGFELPVAAPLPGAAGVAGAAAPPTAPPADANAPAVPPVPVTAAPALAEAPRQPTELISESTRIGGGLLLLAGVATVLTLLWRRFRQAPATPVADSLSTPASADDLAPMPEIEVPELEAKAKAKAEELEAIEFDHPRDTEQAISVSHGFEDEFDDRFTAHLEAAEIMICFGRYQSAAGEVAEFILENPDCGLRPRLALLDIYRRGVMKPEFERLAASLVEKYNIAQPTMDGDLTTQRTLRNLDSFPHIEQRISALWDGAECLAYIQHLTTDTRGGTRSGFDIDAAEELALLESILQLRAEQRLAEPAPGA